MLADYISENIETLEKLKKQERKYKKIFKEIINTLDNGNKILIMGNGGSASDATHIACDLLSRFNYKKKGLSIISLSSNVSVTTEFSNDVSYEDIFIRQVEALGRPGDLIIGLSTSGLSKNVLNALDYGKKNSMKTVLITGIRKNKDYDYVVNIESDKSTVIQNAYMVFLHKLSLDLKEYGHEDRD